MLDVAKQIPLISMDGFGACVREILADSKHEHHMKTYGLRSDVMTLEEMAAVFNKTFKPENTFNAIPVSCVIGGYVQTHVQTAQTGFEHLAATCETVKCRKMSCKCMYMCTACTEYIRMYMYHCAT